MASVRLWVRDENCSGPVHITQARVNHAKHSRVPIEVCCVQKQPERTDVASAIVYSGPYNPYAAVFLVIRPAHSPTLTLSNVKTHRAWDGLVICNLIMGFPFLLPCRSPSPCWAAVLDDSHLALCPRCLFQRKMGHLKECKVVAYHGIKGFTPF